MGALLDAVAERLVPGAVSTSDIEVPQPLSADFDRLRGEFAFPGDDAVLARCFALWAGLVGAISLEVCGQYGADTLADPAAVFDVQIRLWLRTLTN